MRRNFLASAILILGLIFVGSIANTQAANTGILVPVADGAYQQWTRFGGSGISHYTRVDEIPCNGNTDLVYVRTLGFRDSYQINLSSVPNGQVINTVAITPCAGYMALGASTTLPIMNLFYRWNGINSADAGNYTINTLTPATLTPTQFSGLSLTKDTASRLEIGAVYTRPAILSGIAGIKLSNINVVLTYASSTASSTPILPPSNLTATSTATTTPSIRLNWQDNSDNELGFRIQRGTSTTSFSFLRDVGINSTSFTDYFVNSGVTYYYRVCALNISYNCYNGEYSNTASAISW